MVQVSTRFRNSQLRMLPNCGWAYREEYVAHTPGQPSPSLRAGQNVHDAVHLAVREVVNGGIWLNVHELAYRAVRGGDMEYADALQVLTMITESLVDEGGLRIDEKAVFVLEERLEMSIELPDGTVVIFFGTPDLAERLGRRSCRVTDWKTHWWPENQAQFEDDQQLDRYAILINHKYPAFEEFELVKRFVRYDNNVLRKTITKADFPAIMGRLVAEIEVAREREAADDFEATGGAWCGLCAHHHTCPLIAKYREIDADHLSIADDARAAELAGAAIALDAASDRLKSPLKRYLGSQHPTGRVPVAGGGTYGFGPTRKRSIGVEDLQRTFGAHGVEMTPELLKVDLQVLDRLRNRLPGDLVNAIDRITEITEGAQCRYRSAAASRSSRTLDSAEADLGDGEELW